MKWPLAIQQFQNYLRLERGLSVNTIDAYSRDIKKLALWTSGSNQTCITVNKQQIRVFIQALAKEGKSARTQARMRSAMCTFFFFLKEEELREDSPVEGLSAPQLDKKLPIYLSIEEINFGQN